MRSEERVLEGPVQILGSRVFLPLVRLTAHAGEAWGSARAAPYIILLIEPDQITLYCLEGEVELEDLLRTFPNLRCRLEELQFCLSIPS